MWVYIYVERLNKPSSYTFRVLFFYYKQFYIQKVFYNVVPDLEVLLVGKRHRCRYRVHVGRDQKQGEKLDDF